MELSTIKNSDKWGNSTARLNENFSKISTEVDKMKFAAYNSKLYPSLSALQEEIPSPEVGDWAIVGDTIPGDIYRCEVSGEWKATGEQGGGFAMEVVEKHVTENYSNVFNNPESVVNNPDNEDIQSVGEVGKEVIQFADKSYDEASFSGIGRVYLRKKMVNGVNVLDSSQIKSDKQNTRFIVQYDYDLNGATLNVPAGCTIDLNGGSISNGTLALNNTRIVGQGEIRCNITGNVKGAINIEHFGARSNDKTFDNGSVINRVASISGDLYLPEGKYYFSTPIVIGKSRNVKFEGSLYYLGGTKTTALTINGGYSNLISINKVANDENSKVSYENAGEDTYMIGVDIQDCNNCTIYVKDVSSFNENLRIGGIGTLGCSYNLIRFDRLYNGNVGLRVFQDNGGWTNENIFLGGRVAVSSTWHSSNIEAVAIKIAGPQTASDTYDKVNALLFIKVSTEFFRYPGHAVYARNLHSSTFTEGRDENSKVYIKWVANCNRNQVDLGYLRNPTFDYSEATSYPFRWDKNELRKYFITDIRWEDIVDLYNNSQAEATGICAKNYKFNFVRNLSGLTDLNIQTYCGDAWETGFRFTLPAVRLDTSSAKTFYIISYGASIRWQVAYIKNKEGVILTQQDQRDYDAPLSFLYRYGYSTRGFRNGIEEPGGCFLVPDDIYEIEISFEGKFDKVEIYSKELYTPPILVKPLEAGDTTPTYGFIGQTFFNTTLKKPLWCSGQKWVDATGQETI